MISILPFVLKDPPFAMEDLTDFLCQYGCFFNLPLTADPGGGLLLEGRPWEPVPVSVCTAQTEKQYLLSGDQIYRLSSRPENWLPGEGVTLHWDELASENDWVEVMMVRPFGIWWNRYQFTALPCDPELTPVSMLDFRVINGKLTVTGVCGYVEQLWIPAAIDGKPVVNVLLQEKPELRYLHTLVLDEGIEVVQVPWHLPSLTRIRLPDSAKLLAPPHGIRKSAWYGNQTGAVYLGKYYCGTNGDPESDVLTLREGTVGVIDGADSTLPWREIRLPDTVAYLGSGCFSAAKAHLQKVHLAVEKLPELKRAFQSGKDDDPSWPSFPAENCWKLAEPPREDSSGRALYQLFRTGPFVKALIGPGWEPTLPRLSYDPYYGWLGCCWYYSEESSRAGYTIVLSLDTGRLLKFRELPHREVPQRTSVWTADYETPFLLLGKDYLAHCAKMVRKGKPGRKEQYYAHFWWKLCQPGQYRDDAESQTEDLVDRHHNLKAYPGGYL